MGIPDGDGRLCREHPSQVPSTGVLNASWRRFLCTLMFGILVEKVDTVPLWLVRSFMKSLSRYNRTTPRLIPNPTEGASTGIAETDVMADLT